MFRRPVANHPRGRTTGPLGGFRPFVLSDPGLDLSRLPADTLDVLRTVADHQGRRRVGLALDERDYQDYFLNVSHARSRAQVTQRFRQEAGTGKAQT